MSADPDKVWLKTPAKINLFLDILGKRTNGYHDLRSIVIPVSLYDDVALERTDAEIETVVDRFGPERDNVAAGDKESAHPLSGLRSHDNLTTRAALALKKATGYAGGARIGLWKRIPVGGGLGGGSADAAAALIGLNRLWGTGLSTVELMAIGGKIGCDIPALVCGGSVCMEGLGDKITAFQAAQSGWWLVLVNPDFGVSTRDIYSRWKLSLTSEDERFKRICLALEGGDVDRAAAALYNALQATVVRKYPLIGIVLKRVEQAGAIGAQVSGSGASVFGLARDEGHARHIAEGLQSALGFPAWHAVVRTVPDGVMVAHGPLEA